MRNRKEVLTVRVPKELHESLRTLAFATDASMNDIVVDALRAHLAQKRHRDAVARFLSDAGKQYRMTINRLAGV